MPASSSLPFAAMTPPLSRRAFTLSALSLAAGGAAPVVQAQPDAWPARPVKLVVPFPPGGGTDLVARGVGQKLAERLKQAVVIDNRPGASTIIGSDAVAKAAPDGYTLLLSGSTSYTVNPALRSKLPYDPLRDLAPILIVARTPLVLVVNAEKPWRHVNDLIAAAKDQPRSLHYPTFGPGSAPHLAGELFALAAGVQLQDVPYKGSAQAIMALMSGEIELAVDTVPSVAPHIKSGKLRALGIVGSTRANLLPGVPTLRELRLPDAVFDGWFALSAPRQTPQAIVDQLARETTAAMADPGLQTQLRNQGMEPVAIGAAMFRQMMEQEISRYRALAHRVSLVVD